MVDNAWHMRPPEGLLIGVLAVSVLIHDLLSLLESHGRESLEGPELAEMAGPASRTLTDTPHDFAASPLDTGHLEDTNAHGAPYSSSSESAFVPVTFLLRETADGGDAP